jgi:hypothetical protein
MLMGLINKGLLTVDPDVLSDAVVVTTTSVDEAVTVAGDDADREIAPPARCPTDHPSLRHSTDPTTAHHWPPLFTSIAGGLDYLHGGVAQRRPDFIYLQLDDSAFLALLGFERTLLEAAGDDDPGALGEALREVLGEILPGVAPHKQGLAVFPFAALAVVDRGGGGNREVRHRRAGRHESQFR